MILVTGGSGYLGALLIRKLLDKGHFCRVFDLLDASDRPSQVDFIQGDIRDPSVVEAALKNVDVVHHNVAQVPLAKDKHLFESVNFQGAENLLTSAKKLGVRKVVMTSSSAVFGAPKSNPVAEKTTPSPGEAYGRAKFAPEKLCGEYSVRVSEVALKSRG